MAQGDRGQMTSSLPDASVARLLAIEQIRILKARYFRSIDTRDWTALRSIFADHAVFEFPGLGSFDSPDSFVDAVQRVLEDAETVHHGHMPEITFTDDAHASGVWAMYDRVSRPKSAASLPGYTADLGLSFEGYGHYHETYVLIDGAWKIERLELRRLKVVPLAQ